MVNRMQLLTPMSNLWTHAVLALPRRHLWGALGPDHSALLKSRGHKEFHMQLMKTAGNGSACVLLVLPGA